MLRRANATCSSIAYATAAAQTQTRRIAVFSQQHHILEGNQKSRGSPSNVWIEDWEVNRHGWAPLPQAVPTSLMLDKPLELFNFDQLMTAPEVMEAPRHSSYGTRKPYGEKLQFELNDRAAKHGFQSNWWLTKSQAMREHLTFKNGARPSIIIIKSTVRLFHSSQLQNGEELMLHPISGGSRKLYSNRGDAHATLVEHRTNNGFNSGLYFTRRQLEFFKLAVQQGQAPAMMAVASGENFLFYNVQQLEDPELAITTLQRSPVNVPTFLLSGEPIKQDASRFGKFGSNYWLSGRDAELYQWPIKANERSKGVSLNAQGAALQIELYNVEQLTNPEEGFAKSGLFVQ